MTHPASPACTIKATLQCIAAGISMTAAGCAKNSSVSDPPLGKLAASQDRAGQARRSGAEPVAIVGGETLTWDDLRPAMVERAGAEALEEAALDVLLRQMCARAAIVIREPDIKNERGLLVRTVSRTASMDDPQAQRVLEELRARRGLGEYRFRALLERSAMLRALVRAEAGTQGELRATEDDITRAYEVKYGPRVRARIIVLADARDADRVRAALARESFESVASKESIDPSSVHGGMIEPVSLSDPTQPEALRSALQSLAPGAVSPPFQVTWEDAATGSTMSGVAFVKHEGAENRPAAPALESVRTDLGDEVTLVRERAAMERLARRTLGSRGRGGSSDSVQVLDSQLGKAWDNRREAMNR